MSLGGKLFEKVEKLKSKNEPKHIKQLHILCSKQITLPIPKIPTFYQKIVK